MASSSSSSSSSLTSESYQLWNHDVFLSFRGEDTRKTFVDHLYSALTQHGIHTYKDDEALPRGESIGPALLKAIFESRVAVIVFSENYADSSWCLDELAYIMKCMEERGQIVIPIFYHVDPSDVRKQKGKYGEAFVKHDELEYQNKDKVESWRKALAAAGSLSGWVPEHTANGHESKFIKEIVDTISHKLYSLVSNEDEPLIGMETRVQALKFKLEIGSGGVLMIGIWGVGGGGKTALASSVYYNVSGKFDNCCFVKNIREKASRYGLEELQENFLSAVLTQNKVKIGRVEEGRRLIKSRLCHRKVLIVLDDVNHIDHLKALAGSHSRFGEGSRIIITTRDENLLNAHKVNVIHHISLLDDAEAMELFSKHASGVYRPTEDYELLSKDVVSYANGLPLALKVLGSFLCDKDMNEWKSALARLKELSHDDILGTLKISYDGLKDIEKRLFLDIACFLGEKNKVFAMDIFDACGLYPVIGVKVLIQKALITISGCTFDMHDLVQEMGYNIVRGKHPNNPEKHSRIWEKKDVPTIWAMDATKELDKIEAISLGSYMYDSLSHHNRHVISNMKKLRWIDWSDRHASSLPKNFPPGELCCLILRGGQQRQLWKGCKSLPNLKMIKLQFFDNLIVTPDLADFQIWKNSRFLIVHMWRRFIHRSDAWKDLFI
uniref:disease resistance protein Roq1-like n=1 Tax=Erigeron canadensis TaxID=72917 RepID=UPI001CB9A09D|nr:disease resistance protein Roq1-like [Erigeron canadensis]